MDINIVGLIGTIIIAAVAWYANDKLNTVPFLKTVMQVVIVGVSLLLVWSFLGVKNHYIHVG